MVNALQQKFTMYIDRDAGRYTQDGSMFLSIPEVFRVTSSS